MNDKKKKQIGKYISLILRHEPQKINLTLDDAGWAHVSELLAGLSSTRHAISLEQLEEIVSSNNKKRYSFNDDQTKIRANQGHSLDLDLQLEAKTPPEILYHGTATRFVTAINEQGLQKRSRHHVHLSDNLTTATAVGSRHGKPVILEVLSGKMSDDGYTFYQSDNGVWLTDHVPSEYLK